MKPPVTSKTDMTRRLAAGEFGNAIPFWTNYDAWFVEAYKPGLLWGVQHNRVAGYPGTRLDVRSEDVDDVIMSNFGGRDFRISPMVHQFGRVQWEGDVWVCDRSGLSCSGTYGPAPGSWRTHMKTPRLWERTAARALLEAVLNPNSLEDLRILLDEYPGHVVELSALDCCYGTVPGRNAVVWEVRAF